MDRSAVNGTGGAALALSAATAGVAAAARSGSSFDSAELLKALPAAVYTTDAAGRITFYNDAAAALWGCRPELGRSEFCGSWRLYSPDGSALPHSECPMAIALRERRAIRGAEIIAEKPGGTRVPILAYPAPLFDDSGELIGGVNTLVDITDRKEAERAALRLAAIVESSDDAIVSKDLNGIIETWNSAAERLYGYSAGEVIGNPVTILMPPERRDEEPRILERIRRGERIDHYETVRQRKDGSLVDISLTVSPVKDAAGRVIGASKIARDITERKRAQEQQRLILREMNHRVKNLFALAGAVVTLSARSAATPKDLAEAVRDRLASLARAHDLTLPDLRGTSAPCSRAADLKSLVQTIVAPYMAEGHASVALEGPSVPVSGKAVMAIALLLHETATNAAKYGALSSPKGHAEVRWTVKNGALLLRWRERGGPPITREPEHEGFGVLLARLTVTGQLGGKLSYDWEREGLTVNISAPLDRLSG
jgi:PAS domain S-box-containing protein